MTQHRKASALMTNTQRRFDREEIDQRMKAHATGKGGSKA